MIAGVVTDTKNGAPVEFNGKQLSQSAYNPSEDVMELFSRVQDDYTVAYNLQHRPFNEFDGLNLLERTRRDQESFAAFVGAQYIPTQKQWRWRGRKNTTRNRIIGILAQMLSAMLFPYVRAVNDKNEEEKDAARVMQILVEDFLRKAGYETKFLYMVMSALVNPAVFVSVEYVQAIQRIKQRSADGTMTIVEAVDEFLSGMQMHIIPIDEILLADFYTFELQRQPYLIRVRRIAWDEARNLYGQHKDFKYVQAGKTRIVLTGQENQTLFDIDWTEADRDYVQEITAFYRSEDLQVTFVGGVFMGEEKDVYNSNPFEHRRMILSNGKWMTAPIYPFAKSGFEPLDVTGRFAYYKSAAFKAYWDDASINKAYQLLQDGMYLDVFKPMFISGVSKTDGTVIAPGASVPLPKDAAVTPFQLGPNLAAAMNVLMENKEDLAESTQDQTQGGVVEPNVTARATLIAERNAKIILGVFGLMLSNLVEQVGGLVIDCIIQHATIGDVDRDVPEGLAMRYQTFLAKGEEKGKEISNRIEFTDDFMGIPMTKQDKLQMEWELFNSSGETPEERLESNQRIYRVNPYQFARMNYFLYVDPDQIVQKSMGTDQERNILAFNMLTDPRVAPFVDQKAVIEDFVVDQFADGDPDRYMAKQQPAPNPMLAAVMGNNTGAPQQAGAVPSAQPALPTTSPTV
jgi:hypothetical protein